MIPVILRFNDQAEPRSQDLGYFPSKHESFILSYLFIEQFARYLDRV